MGRDGDGDGAVDTHLRAGVSWEGFGTAVHFISSHFLCFVPCFFQHAFFFFLN
jgi:hypothetical protein